jgi:hypothetical protein
MHPSTSFVPAQCDGYIALDTWSWEGRPLRDCVTWWPSSAPPTIGRGVRCARPLARMLRSQCENTMARFQAVCP